MSAPSPARLSSLCTTTLSLLLELTRSHRLQLPASPSLTRSIQKNLILLRSGIDSLSLAGNGEGSDEVLQALKDQEERLLGLLGGLGVILEGVGPTTKTGRLVDAGDGVEDQVREEVDAEADAVATEDDDDTFPLMPSTRANHTTIDMSSSAAESLHQMEEDEASMRRANSEVMQMQRQMIEDQDSTLTSLSSAISRQHALSLNISSELELHEDLLDETDEALDRTTDRLRRASGRLSTIGRRAKDTGSTGLIVLLVVILVVLLVVFKT